ncbi:unnamed protein product [Nippostrongylus brasiliensis]|uniref:UNC93-like protein MFSD11 (inferred by orthology to a human protein) n=1 Tax=Nippostrongylus brasiliensis TaxID=27835 RepID=A0A158R0E6_NIPBR|nr:unnamed protein product [Nippostrongylus brasiliensis]
MRKDLLIILQLGFGFFTVFSAFNSQGFIEISVLRSLSQHDPASGITSNSGYYSLAIIYFVFTICNLLTPPIISVLGSKWAQVLGAICYTSFMIQFLFINAWRLYLFSAVLGFGAAVIWTANGVYLVQFSRLGKMARNSGILWAMLQSSLVAGAIFLLIVLSYGDLFSSYRFIYGAFAVASSFGVVILALLPASPSFTCLRNDASFLGGLSFGVFPHSNRLNRSQIVILGMILHVTAFFLCFLNLPMEAPLHKTSAVGYIEPSVFVAIVTAYFLGLADSCWNTQIYTLIGARYKDESSCAFALFKFFQSLSACASFYYSSVLLLHWQLLFLCLGAASAAICFFFAANDAEQREEVE